MKHSMSNQVPSSSQEQMMKKRIASIDILRGLVMLLMLVDHVRERFFYHQQVTDPMTLDSTSTELFFTRITAHFCAPVFVFLTGLSAWLYANPVNKPPRSAAEFLFKRGLFIILVEATLINLSWFGTYHVLYLQVMWAIGVSMIALAALVALPRWVIGTLGLTIVFGHNALSWVQFEPSQTGYTLWSILHDRGFIFESEIFKVKASYPVLPWIGVILLGYFIAPIFSSNVTSSERQRLLITIGLSSLGILAMLRGFNIYGETLPWVAGANSVETIKAMINFTKYPPSLGFILFTLGVALLVLSSLEKVDNKLTKIIEGFGSAPMFFYVLHLYVLLFMYKVLVSLYGTSKGDYWGVDHLWQIWLISIVLAFVLYWPTKAFSEYKKRTSTWWIKYC